VLKVWREEEPGTGPGRVLQRWVHLVQSYPKATLGVCMGVAVLSILYSWFSLDFKTSRTDLVHPSQASAQDWKRYASQFGEESDIIVVVAGADQPTIIAALKTIARDVSAYPQLFEKLCYRIDAERLRAKGLYQLDLAQLQEIRKRLETFSPLLVGAWDWMSVDNVLRATRFRIASISLEDPLDQESYLALENSVRLVESLESFISDGRVYRSPWQSLLKQRASELSEQTPEYFFSPDGKMAILRVAPIPRARSDSYREIHRML
jgi:predicted RND superfamily exporter protein